jgi:hypothetical protein
VEKELFWGRIKISKLISTKRDMPKFIDVLWYQVPIPEGVKSGPKMTHYVNRDRIWFFKIETSDISDGITGSNCKSLEIEMLQEVIDVVKTTRK